GGTARAFVLSLADVTRLSGPGLGFPNHAQRAGANSSWWWTRTSASSTQAWHVSTIGNLIGSLGRMHSATLGGVRPALILHQARN
ncbi:DUF6273 domain-containing protein, partial [Lactococcus garvieae]|uniref:DUF6273 domain-containing protein n=1 Tax=Lactococcus garvieae TaxID=1363 RepID=UPI00385494B7